MVLMALLMAMESGRHCLRKVRLGLRALSSSWRNRRFVCVTRTNCRSELIDRKLRQTKNIQINNKNPYQKQKNTYENGQKVYDISKLQLTKEDDITSKTVNEDEQKLR